VNTVQDVFLKFYPQYKEKYTPSAQQSKAAEDIMHCKTADLGGHAQIALSNTRIISINEQTVSFTIKDYKNKKQKKILTLKGIEMG
jgi:hypothetical protein